MFGAGVHYGLQPRLAVLLKETNSVDIAAGIYEVEFAQIRRFVAVVDCGTFVAAAQKLGLTQQALSASIAKMEELAGVRFLERRRGGRVALTVFGRLLYDRARSLISISERTMSEIALLRSAQGGTVTLGVGETMTGRNVAAAIRRYHREQPDVQIRLIEGYTESMIEKLNAGEVDFVVGGPSHDPADKPFLDFYHLFEIRDTLAVRRQHPLARRSDLSLADLAPYPWIVPNYRSDVYEAITVGFMRAKLPPPKCIIRSDAIGLGTWLCLDDDFIITASPDMMGALFSLGAMVPLEVADTTLVRHACVITRRDVKLSPAAGRLMEEIILECERSPKMLPMAATH